VDDAGRGYALLSTPPKDAGTNKSAAPVVVAFKDLTFLFEGPPPDVRSLRLEIPINVAGVSPFRFTIPEAMLRSPTPEASQPSLPRGQGSAPGGP
jgi:hypothetical protein